MSDWSYLNFTLKLETQPEELLPVFIKGSINQSLTTVFGEIGGQIDFDLIQFDETVQKGILRVPTNSISKTRVALTLVSKFQDIPAVFQVHQTSAILSALTASYIQL